MTESCLTGQTNARAFGSIWSICAAESMTLGRTYVENLRLEATPALRTVEKRAFDENWRRHAPPGDSGFMGIK